MKKSYILLIFLLFGCSNHENDKEQFINQFKEIESALEFSYGFISVHKSSTMMSYEINENDIGITTYLIVDDLATKYTYSNDGYYYITTYYNSNKEIIDQTENIDISRSTFKTEFIDYDIFKVPIDWDLVETYNRTEHKDVPSDPAEWDNRFTFNNDYDITWSLFGSEYIINSISVYFESNPKGEDPYSISSTTIKGLTSNSEITINVLTRIKNW